MVFAGDDGLEDDVFDLEEDGFGVDLHLDELAAEGGERPFGALVVEGGVGVVYEVRVVLV